MEVRMQLIQEREGWNWRMDDQAGLYLKDTGKLAEPPATVTAHIIGHCFNEAETREVEISRLEYLAEGTFDKTARRRWTGDYLKFAVYLYKPEYEDTKAVIMRTDGGGHYFYYVADLDAERLFRTLADSLSPDSLWSLLGSLVHTYEKGRKDEKAKIYGLFMQDRVKRRKRHGGRQFIEILPAPKEATVTA
jgi:hypothetical protein